MDSAIREYRLKNGLKVLLKENHVAPVIAVAVVYRVGSKYEFPGSTGMSHLLEHMMFKGSKKYPIGEFDRILTIAGADHNAYTWMDETVYYEVIDKAKLEVALELEADRMRNLVLTEEEFQTEIAVVKNELEQKEDSPPTLLFETLASLAFQVHPYSLPTIGWLRDLVNLKVGSMKAFYDTWYQPANAFLVLVGDFVPDEILPIVERHFGDIPTADIRAPQLPEEPGFLGSQRVTIQKPGTSDYLLIGFLVPSSAHPDSYPLIILSNVLGSGRTSRLYKSLVETGMASFVFASGGSFERAEPFLFLIGAGVNSGVSLETVEEKVIQELKLIKSEGITAEELNRAKKQAKVAFVYDKDSVQSEASTIVAFELLGSYTMIESFLPSLEKVTAEDVRGACCKYLTSQNSITGYFIGIRNKESASLQPSANQAPPIEQTSSPEKKEAEPPRQKSYAGRNLASHKKREITPSAIIGAGAKPENSHFNLNSPPKDWRVEKFGDLIVAYRADGLRLLIKECHANPTVAYSLRLGAGAVFAPVEKKGLARLVAESLMRGTKEHSSEDINRILEDNGMELAFSAGYESVSCAGRSLSEDFSRFITLLAEVLQKPSFPESEVDKARIIIDNEITRSEDDTFDTAYITARDLLFGHKNPYSGRVSGTHASLIQISRQDMLNFHKKYFVPNNSFLSIVGDIDSEEALKKLSAVFSEWAGEVDLAEMKEIYSSSFVSPTASSKVVTVPMADKLNASVVFVKPGLSRMNEKYYCATLANYVFGGDILSRLNTRLRVEEGLTYGAFSFLQPAIGASPWVISAETSPADVDRTIKIILEEWEKFYEMGITEEELFRAKSFLTGNFPVRLDNVSAVAQSLVDIAYFDLGYDYLDKFPSIIEGLELSEVNEAIREFYAPEGWICVSAGSVKAENL